LLELIKSFSELINLLILSKVIKQFYIDLFVNIFIKNDSNNIYLL